jgi:2-methylisocitrate lyase-like PEP mutase family enzyme
MTTTTEKRTRFRQLHQSGCFLLPNPWDIGSAKRLEKLGFRALASTSAGAAWALGKDDGELSRDEVIAHLEALCASTDLPVNADFESGFGATTKGLQQSVTLAVQAGVAGLSIEDFNGTALYDMQEAADRVRAAREAIDRAAPEAVLVGRCDAYFREKDPNLSDTIRRLVAYSEAGADCLYAPAVTDLFAIREIVKAVAPKPVNVLLWGDLTVPELAEAGVRRVSTGGALAHVAFAAMEQAARNLLERGTLK